MKFRFSAHRWNTDAISIARDAAYDATDEIGGAGMFRRPETQAVEQRDGACAHREDISQNTTHPGGRALVWFDEGGVIVAFHFECDGHALA